MKDVVPITSGSTSFFGLNRNEWIIQSYVFMIYMAIIVQAYGFERLPIASGIHLLILIIVVTLFKNVEQNVFAVLWRSKKIGKVIIGTIERKYPIEESFFLPTEENCEK